ncbi:sulfite exporter TauE/SafE family protein [Oenococcus sp. UCMA 17063]|nr:sulfite exporter TauE/SafE family protein [Oenococcus sp. UCMA 17063]
MLENLNSWFILFPAGILAGILSSATGLASLISYPTLLAIGVPPVFADVTNTAALVLTGFGSSISSQKELKNHKKELLKILPLTVLGSAFGSVILLVEPVSSFTHLVPFFILFAGLLLLFPTSKERKGIENQTLKKKNTRYSDVLKKFAYMSAVFLVGAYGGYFGAAAGVIMLAIFSITSKSEFPVYNALKNVSLGFSNLVATIIYTFKSHIYWLLVIPLGAGLFLGGYIGPKIVRVIPGKILKIAVGVGAIILAASLFIQAYK